MGSRASFNLSRQIEKSVNKQGASPEMERVVTRRRDNSAQVKGGSEPHGNDSGHKRPRLGALYLNKSIPRAPKSGFRERTGLLDRAL